MPLESIPASEAALWYLAGGRANGARSYMPDWPRLGTLRSDLGSVALWTRTVEVIYQSSEDDTNERRVHGEELLCHCVAS